MIRDDMNTTANSVYSRIYVCNDMMIYICAYFSVCKAIRSSDASEAMASPVFKPGVCWPK